MSNIKITIEGVEKEFEPINSCESNPFKDTFFNNQWYREVTPKQDYEILSFRDIGRGKIFKFNHIHYTAHQEGHYSNEQMLAYVKRNLFAIHSVKRLSDGEVFSVKENEKKIGNISRIELVIDEIFLHSEGGLIRLANAEKVKQPTIHLKTEDGVNITNGEQVIYGINDIYLKSDHKAVRTFSGFKYFSTEAARDKYIMYNKPITITMQEYLDSNLSALIFFKSKQK